MTFDSWWNASKYYQVVVPESHWRQIALDAYRAGQESMRERAAKVAAKVANEDRLWPGTNGQRIRALPIE